MKRVIIKIVLSFLIVSSLIGISSWVFINDWSVGLNVTTALLGSIVTAIGLALLWSKEINGNN